MLKEREKTAAKAAAERRPAMRRKLDENIRFMETTVRMYPTRRSYRALLGNSYLMLGISRSRLVVDIPVLESLLSGRGGLAPAARAETEATLALFDRALATFPDGDDSRFKPDNPPIPILRFETHQFRAVALAQLGRFTESLLAFDEVVALADPATRGKWQTFRSVMLRGAEIEQQRAPWSRPPRADHARAIRMAEALLSHEGVQPEAIYNAVCVFSLASQDTKAVLAERRRRADRALKLLRRIADQGYFRPARPGLLGLLRSQIMNEQDPLALLQKDPDLNPLRDRADFQALVTLATTRASVAAPKAAR